ncbi:MAG: L-2-amino-thiazoline-4-carboxylic acid hydrolase [Spirochaetaceae bacterium]|nr:L-2-amino-thiazoline-4-carboxylic acid hydrolase [Myxococcales bacterium]MCB9724779.1 L-2-amino-thiazoline-4-carboxylic acid hydrolase [Spirochaetaceae bacterium]HPG26456.1 L-2-amino-thiazoline-4-carboxylic acid hydrolase [Myxococcota bacterium]
MSLESMTALERITIEMEHVVPLVRDLQAILGDRVVREALAERQRRRAEAARRSALPAIDASAIAPALATFAAGEALEYEIVRADSDALEVDVTRCAYVALMDRLDARDLGPVLLCDRDHELAATAGLELVRTTTCMQGGACCDFRFRRRR